MKECEEMLRVVNLGMIEYDEALNLQKMIQCQRIDGQCDDTLLLLEHPPVLTKGIRGVEENILVSREYLAAHGVKVHESNRGGDVTYLGPGQIIGYVIMDLNKKNRDIRKVVANIEQAIINIMEREFGITAYTGNKKYTGVFVENDKLAAIGIAVNKRVTMHGFAFNVNTNLKHFDWIVPCGLKDRGVTSVASLTGNEYDRDMMLQKVVSEFETLFDIQAYQIDKDTLIDSLGVGTDETGMVEDKWICG